MKNIAEKYEIIRGLASDEELLEYQKCFLKNGSKKELEVLKWFHKKNLQNVSLILYAKDKNDGEIAAIYTYLPILLKCVKNVLPALQSFDTLTDEKHQGQGLFVGLEIR